MNVSDIQSHYIFNLIIWDRISAAVDLLSYIFLSIADVLLTPDLKCSHFVNEGICQFLIMVWCVHSFWFIKDLSSRTGYKAFNNHEWWDTYVWVEWVVVNKLSHQNPSEPVSLKLIFSLSEVKLQKLIDVFCLIICFWMKSSWEFDINVYMKIYLFSEITDKLRITIWYNKIRSIIFLIKFHELGAVYTDSINFLYRHKCGIF